MQSCGVMPFQSNPLWGDPTRSNCMDPLLLPIITTGYLPIMLPSTLLSMTHYSVFTYIVLLTSAN